MNLIKFVAFTLDDYFDLTIMR